MSGNPARSPALRRLDSAFGDWVEEQFGAAAGPHGPLLGRLACAASHALHLKHTCLDLRVAPGLSFDHAHGQRKSGQKNKSRRAQMGRPADKKLQRRYFSARRIPEVRISGVSTGIENMRRMVHCHEHHDDAAHGVNGGQTSANENM